VRQTIYGQGEAGNNSTLGEERISYIAAQQLSHTKGVAAAAAAVAAEVFHAHASNIGQGLSSSSSSSLKKFRAAGDQPPPPFADGRCRAVVLIIEEVSRE
jgi:hypothetical protein